MCERSTGQFYNPKRPKALYYLFTIYGYNEKLVNSMYDMHAKMLKAMSDTTRLYILDLLRNGKLCVCEIIPLIEASQSNISQHLRILRDAGIIELEKRGRENYYYVVNEKIFKITDLVNEAILETLKMQIAELEG